MLNEDTKYWVDCWKKITDRSNLVDDEKQATRWNKRSNDFAKDMDEERRQFKNTEFISLLDEAGFSPEGAKVLDIGCGPGTLSIPLAEAGADVTSLDISSGMLERLKETVDKENLHIKFIECSWWTADIDMLGLRDKFDLVIASFTPGIRDVETFDKMVACSKKYCYYSNFISKDPAKIPGDIYIRILKKMPLDNIFAGGLLFPFMYLYTQGFHPIIKFSHKSEDREEEWSMAAEKAIDFLQLNLEISDEIKEDIREYYKNISINGIYRSKSDLYKGMMVWSVNMHGIIT